MHYVMTCKHLCVMGDPEAVVWSSTGAAPSREGLVPVTVYVKPVLRLLFVVNALCGGRSAHVGSKVLVGLQRRS
jgi:hypothetical protein